MKEKRLTGAERTVMEVLWENLELSNSQITKILDDETGWSRHTVKTYTNSLVSKGFLKANQLSQRRVFYKPTMSKDEYLAMVTGNHLRENYQGLNFMVAGLIKNEEVSDDEIEALEKLLSDYKEK